MAQKAVGLPEKRPLKHRAEDSYACAHCGAIISHREPHLEGDKCGYGICPQSCRPCPK